MPRRLLSQHQGGSSSGRRAIPKSARGPPLQAAPQGALSPGLSHGPPAETYRQLAWSARLFLLEMILPSFLCVRCIVTFFDPASVFLPRPEAEGESLLFRQRQSVLRGRLPGEFVAEAPLPAVPSRTRCGDAEGPQPGSEGGSPLCCPRRGSRPSFRRCPRSEASNRPQGFGL